MLRRRGWQAVAAAQMKLIWAGPSGPRAPAEDHRPGLWRPADRLAYQVRHAQRGTWAGQAARWVRALAPAGRICRRPLRLPRLWSDGRDGSDPHARPAVAGLCEFHAAGTGR